MMRIFLVRDKKSNSSEGSLYWGSTDLQGYREFENIILTRIPEEKRGDFELILVGVIDDNFNLTPVMQVITNAYAYSTAPQEPVALPEFDPASLLAKLNIK